MEFREYMHVERLDNVAVDGILNGTCYIYPKIDGTNASFWSDGLEVFAGSRTRKLGKGANDNAGFYEWLMQQGQEALRNMALHNPHLIFYGEWLVPNTLRTYAVHAWKKFYLFDVYDRETESYVHPASIIGLLKGYGVSVMDTWIPPLDVKVNPTREELYGLLQSNTYLIPADKGIGEGIVIKNYSFVNRFGRTIWAKIINSEFKHKQTKEARPENISGLIEEKIVDKYITEAVIDKDIIKVQQQRGVDYWDNKFIPQLFEQVYNTLITEEMYDIVARKFKNCVIDFKLLKNITINKIKQIKKDMF